VRRPVQQRSRRDGGVTAEQEGCCDERRVRPGSARTHDAAASSPARAPLCDHALPHRSGTRARPVRAYAGKNLGVNPQWKRELTRMDALLGACKPGHDKSAGDPGGSGMESDLIGGHAGLQVAA
jgi:hypothetical protein